MLNRTFWTNPWNTLLVILVSCLLVFSDSFLKKNKGTVLSRTHFNRDRHHALPLQIYVPKTDWYHFPLYPSTTNRAQCWFLLQHDTTHLCNFLNLLVKIKNIVCSGHFGPCFPDLEKYTFQKTRVFVGWFGCNENSMMSRCHLWRLATHWHRV